MNEVKVESFLDFLDKCVTPYHFCEYAKSKLLAENYIEMPDRRQWDTIPEKGFIIRSGRALIAFQIDKSQGMPDSMIIVGTHDDSPCLKVKPNYDSGKGVCKEILVASYGGGRWYTWFDRGLRLAGRVYTSQNGGEQFLFDSVEPVAICPSSIISDNPDDLSQSELLPFTGFQSSQNIISYIETKLNLPSESITQWDLSLLDAEPASTFSSLVCSGRIDNLGSTFAGLTAFLNSKPKNTVNILVVFDNEEIGSSTPVGALGDFLSTCINHLFENKSKEVIAKSLLISADNAHAIHPNYPQMHEKLHSPLIGHGLTIKKSPGSSYATDLTSEFPLRQAALKLGLNLQELINRNDIPGGSTIGPLSSALL